MRSATRARASGASGASAPRALAITCAASFLGFLDVTIVNVAFPSISRSFAAASPAHLSWVLNSYNVLFAAFLLPCGALADRVGRKRAFAGGLSLFAAASALCAASPSLDALIAARAIQALAAALVIPSSLAILLGEIAQARRARAIALWAAAGAVAAGVGPSLGGLIVEASTWRYVFLINVPLALALLAACRELAPTPAVAGRPPDLLGGAAISLAMGALAMGIAKGEAWHWGSVRDLSCFAIALASLAVFATRNRRASTPMVPPTLLGDLERNSANAATIVFATAFYAGILGNVLFLTGVWHYSILKAGLAISPAPLTSAPVGAIAGRHLGRVGPRALVLAGSAIYGCGMAYLALRATGRADYLGVWLPGAIVLGCGIGLVFPALGAGAAASLLDAEFAIGSALNTVARQLGAVLGTALVFAILHEGLAGASISPYRRIWVVAVMAAAATAAVGLLLPTRERSTASEPTPSLASLTVDPLRGSAEE
jgi:NTE family protein